MTSAETRRSRTGTGVLAQAVSAIVTAALRARDAVARGAARATAIVTLLGWAVLVGSPIVLLGGYVLGWREFVALGWAGITVSIIAVLYLAGRPRIQVDLIVPRRRVVAGSPAAAVLTARAPAGRRSLTTTVEIAVGDGLVEVVIPGLAGGGEHLTELALPTERRGLVPVGPVRAIRADPIGLVRREVVWGNEQQLIVHPRTVSAASVSTGLIHDLEGATTRDLSSSDLAFHALRDYQPGDERRHIHWKSSAKTGNYMVRQFEQTRRSHLAVVLSLAPEDYADDEQVELAVSAAASLGVRAVRDGRTVSVAVSGLTAGAVRRRRPMVRDLSTHRPQSLLDDLALVELVEGAGDLHDIARVVADRSEEVSLAYLVTGAATPPARLRAAVNSFAADVAVVAVICDPEALPGERLLAGIDVVAVGLLEDLRLALRRTAALR